MNNKARKKRKTELEKLQEKFPLLPQPKAWAPINLTREYLHTIFSQYWKSPSNYNIDKALAVCTSIIVNRYRTSPEKRDGFWHDGYTHVHSAELRKWVGKNYSEYTEVLKLGKVIEVYDKYLEGAYPKSYRFLARWVNNDSDRRKFKQVAYEDYHMKLKVIRHKVSVWEKGGNYVGRSSLVGMAKRIALDYDIAGLEEFLYKKKLRNPLKIEERERQLVKYTMLKELDQFWYVEKDDFGGRLHTPFTTMKKEFRKFIRINGEKCAEIDLKNSQLYFFACLCQHLDLLSDSYNDCEDLMTDRDFDVWAYKLAEKNAEEDGFKFFNTLALDGSIYEYIQHNLYEDKVISRKAAKKALFRTMFSDGTYRNDVKDRIVKLFPVVMDTCFYFNKDGKKLIPKLLQTVESMLMIDFVGFLAEDRDVGLKSFITVHDSVICAASEAEKFKDHILKTFSGWPFTTWMREHEYTPEGWGLPAPVLHVKILE